MNPYAKIKSKPLLRHGLLRSMLKEVVQKMTTNHKSIMMETASQQVMETVMTMTTQSTPEQKNSATNKTTIVTVWLTTTLRMEAFGTAIKMQTDLETRAPALEPVLNLMVTSPMLLVVIAMI